MATISNPTDPNKTVATSNVAPQPTSASGTQTPTGQYSTLQKYLSANQGSGQRLAGAIGSNVNKEITGLKDTTGREINEAGVANQNIGNLTGKTTGYTSSLSAPNPQPGMTQPTTDNPTAQGFATSDKFDLSNKPDKPVVKKAYDVNSYAANLSGANAAADIAKNQDELNTFRGIATGDTSSQLKNESKAQAQQALDASAKAYDVNKERQSQLNNFGDRSTLLQKAINSRNQRAGLQNLDNALLSQDKSGTLNQVNQGLQTNTKGLQESKNVAQTKRSDVDTLAAAQMLAESGLNTRLTNMTKEQQDALTERVGMVNAAKDAQNLSLENKFKLFKETGEVDDELFNALKLGEITDVDAEARRRLGLPTISGKMSPSGAATSDQVRLFNSMNNRNKVSDAVDTGLLNTKANSGKDVANQSDIDHFSILNKLMGGTLQDNLSLSKFTGEQLGDSALKNAANEQAANFLNTMSNDKVSLAAVGGRAGKNQHGGQTAALASNADYLYKDQVKKYIDSSGAAQRETYNINDLDRYASNGSLTALPSIGTAIGGLGQFNAPVTEGWNKRSGYKYTDGIDSELAQRSEDAALGTLAYRINEDLNTQGYRNLAKRIKGR